MKALPRGSFLVRPFKTYKGQLHPYVYESGNNPLFITIDEAAVPPVGWQWGETAEPVNDESGIYKRSLYKSVEQMFYHSSSLARQQINRGWSLSSATSGAYVVSVSQYSFGEQIRPGSFCLTTSEGTGSIVDDELGKLYFNTPTGSVIGNIFYPLGIAVIPKMTSTTSLTGSVISHEGLYLTTGNTVYVGYHSQLTLYEHMVLCTLERGEFNFSTNPSLRLFSSSSVSGSTKLMDDMLTGSLTPYITTIGLYNSIGEPIAVAKVPRPIKRAVELNQSFVVRFDI